MKMSLRAVTFGAAVFAAVLLGVAGWKSGYHSTAAFWLAALNLPGLVVASWLQYVVKPQNGWTDGLLLCLTALTNWAAWWAVAKAVFLLWRRRSGSGDRDKPYIGS